MNYTTVLVVFLFLLQSTKPQFKQKNCLTSHLMQLKFSVTLK